MSLRTSSTFAPVEVVGEHAGHAGRQVVVGGRDGAHELDDLGRRWGTLLGVVGRFAGPELAGGGVDEHEGCDAIRVPDGELLGDKPAVGVAEHPEAVEAEVVGEPDRVVGELFHREGGKGWPARTAVAPMIEMDEPHRWRQPPERVPVQGVVDAEPAVEDETRRAVTVDLVEQLGPVRHRGRHRRRA